MKTTPVTFEDLQSSVIAVPPLCRNKDLSLSKAQNNRLIKHMHKGGIRTLLYGGNANLYNIAVSEYHWLLRMLLELAPEDMWIVPSVGPMYGTAMDQAKILTEFAFPTAMLLPTLFPSKPAGVATAVRHFVEKSGIKAVLYIKDAAYITPELAAELVNDGLISWIKYAIVEEDPKNDPYLKKLVKLVDPNLIVSGIGEQPAITHMRDFGVAGFTAGCVCVAPSRSTAMLKAILKKDYATAEAIRQEFVELEDLRNAHSPILVLHHAVELAGVAQTGAVLPLLTELPENLLPKIEKAAKALLEKNG
ncbi:MAG: dihydrodipicolinate synthase family protein [Prosthecobacter sp.]|jgi:dihydrodipicolinate synthase/N-acetylneuraminate lyase|uniref:dihydrodipicolinate synthase family protein n=1 Tax=Prosthecobacter sp. TaxID=1965333 RepID=UPI0019F317DA|nr:dihydrodipicolinate synthase family protein [Prosthecobacter sp.]MBE2282950.1 dihydrodipicolinate synthase family protein [Prosthecobacter sp.]